MLSRRRGPTPALLRLGAISVATALVAVAAGGCGSSPGAASSGVTESDSPPSELITVPDVIGSDGESAQSTLEGEGLEVTFDVDPYDPAACEVTNQDPSDGTELDPNSDSIEVTVELDCPQDDWENQEGAAWDEFDSAYTAGWDSGCSIAFDGSPNGSLYEDDSEYTATDCQLNNPRTVTGADVPIDVPDDPTTDGTALGEHDGCVSAFDDLSLSGTLNYGDQSYSSLDCPN